MSSLNVLDYHETSPPASSHDSSDPPEFISRPEHIDEDEDEDESIGAAERHPRRKDGYDSRIQQILYEDKNLEIIITDAAKDHGGGGFIVYTIRTGVNIALRGSPNDPRLMMYRRLKYEDDIPNSALCAQLWSIFTQP